MVKLMKFYSTTNVAVQQMYAYFWFIGVLTLGSLMYLLWVHWCTYSGFIGVLTLGSLVYLLWVHWCTYSEFIGVLTLTSCVLATLGLNENLYREGPS